MGSEFRLYGPPGTGKTTWIVKKVKAYVEKYDGDQISLCSLTNTAIKEVVSRDIPIPRKNISTLHARCKRALFAGDPAESDVKEFISDNKAWSSTAGNVPCLPAHMAKAKDESILSGNQISLFEHAQILRQQMIQKDRWPPLVKKFSDVWENWCHETGRMDFTGWLEEALRLRVLPPQQAVFIDEAQDHTPLQLAVIRSWQTKETILAGDDDQNLYEWSGADPQAFFKTTADSIEERVLSQSYRVPVSVWRMADQIVKKIHRRKDKVYKPRDFEGSVTLSDYTVDNAYYNGNLPDSLLKNPDETYMLIASCAYMLDPIISCLREQRIPFHNPFRPSITQWNPLRPFIKCIESFVVDGRYWTGNETMVWAETLRAKDVFKPRMKQRFIDLCESLGHEEITKQDIDKYFIPKYRDMAVNKDVQLIKEGRSSDKGIDWDYAWDVYNSGDWKPRVIVGTIHSVKGGEADNVYVFPDLSSAGLNDYLGSGADRIHRLFYVGVTRARKNLILCAQRNAFKAIRW